MKKTYVNDKVIILVYIWNVKKVTLHSKCKQKNCVYDVIKGIQGNWDEKVVYIKSKKARMSEWRLHWHERFNANL